MALGSRYCNEVDVPGDEVYVTYSTTQLLKLLQSHGYSIAVRGCAWKQPPRCNVC